MFAGRKVAARLEGSSAGRDRTESVGLGRKGSCENAHEVVRVDRAPFQGTRHAKSTLSPCKGHPSLAQRRLRIAAGACRIRLLRDFEPAERVRDVSVIDPIVDEPGAVRWPPAHA